MDDMFFRLFARMLSGDASAGELEQLEKIIKQRPDLQFFYNQLIKPAGQHEKSLERAEQAYISDVMNMQLQGIFADNNQSLPLSTPSKQKSVFFAKKIYKGAIAVAALIIGWILIVNVIDKKTTEETKTAYTGNETVTTKRSKSTLQLPDGTVVMLNANSKLRYDENFKKNKREVTLEGEAYFDVAHDAEHPFVIHTANADITVLGTVFNVRALQSGYFETALIEGKVAVALKNTTEGSFLLKPGQKLMVEDKKETTTGQNNISAIKIDAITMVDSLVAETAWTQDQLVFADKPLIEIAETLEKVFDVEIIFKSEKAKYFRYNGVYSDTDLNEILNILNLSKHFNYTRKSNLIVIE